VNILVIPEDFRKDQYMLKPLITRLLWRLGAPNPKVEICRDPLLGGIGEALKSNKLAAIVDDHRGMTDIFILCVDRDGDTGRRQRLNELEVMFGTAFLAENAWQEIETWVLAGLDLPGLGPWAKIRAERDVKEQYFEPLADHLGLTKTLGGGRKLLGYRASRNIPAIRQKCPEDFDSLAQRLESTLKTGT
jgi:hypothetical protein